MRHVLCCALLLAIAGCDRSSPQPPGPDETAISVDERANGSTVAMTVGQRFTVTLWNYGDGGFSGWAITTSPDPAVLTSIASWHVPPGPDAMPGNFGSDAFEFEAAGLGSTSFVATASQPWTNGQTVSFSLGVTVR